MEIKKEELGRRIIQLQDALNLNSRQFAIRVGIDPSQMSKIEKGMLGLSPLKALDISTKTGAAVDWILYGKGELSVGKEIPNNLTVNEDFSTSYVEKRRNSKQLTGPHLVPLVPVSAQGGYSKSYNNSDFLNKLEYYPIVPGVDPHGAIWRYFQVDGDSMLDLLHNGDYVLASQVPKEDWQELKEKLVYVIVTNDLVTVKHVMKRKGQFILIPRNDLYEQKAVNIEDVNEIWKYRRHIGWNASTPKKFEIKI